MAKTWRDYLRNEFRKLQRALPDLAGDARLVASGSFGMVIEHPDKTLSKVFYGSSRPDDQQESILRNFYHETRTLAHFAAHPLDGIEMPVLIGEPEHIYHPGYLATYRMTRVGGANHSFDPDKAKSHETPTSFERLYESAGIMLARFHRAAKDMDFANPNMHPHSSMHISTVPKLPARVNRALEKAEEFFQANQKPGVIHGDFHGGNILVQGGIATGLIDFSFTGPSSNLLADVWNGRGLYNSAFLRGYERESGEMIDPYMLDATSLAYTTHALRTGRGPSDYGPASDTLHLVVMNEALNRLVPVTGFKP